MPRQRYGVASWFGVDAFTATMATRADLAAQAVMPRSIQECPHLTSYHGTTKRCSKKGGVCSIRVYEERPSGAVSVGAETALCPFRFYERSAMFTSVGALVLGTERVAVTKEVEFLASPSGEAVGLIDAVLQDRDDETNWCAIELQAVYFSGDAMPPEFGPLGTSRTFPFPIGDRHPDFRSSGPKRLMPQLQIKVPTLRRWGKKMAVVIDKPFFDSLGTSPRRRTDISLCDIVWVVVDYTTGRLAVVDHAMTTLEDSVEWLTGGTPVSLTTFEARLAAKPKHVIT